MTAREAFEILQLCFLLLCGSVLWFQCWVPYRIDSFRQDLFDLRDRLFQFAAEGKVPFDHPAYTNFRMTINGLIRYGHRITTTRLALGLFMQMVSPHPQFGAQYRAWDKAVKQVGEKEGTFLMQLWGEMVVKLILQLVSISPISVLMIICVGIYLKLYRSVAHAFNAAASRMANMMADIGALEAKALRL